MTGKQSQVTTNGQVTTIDLLRHGECEGGMVYRGSIDVALNDTGWRQMRGAVSDFRGWSKIVTSPMQRCRLFATELSDALGLSLEHDAAFREIHFGDWEGQLIEDIWKKHKNNVRHFFSDPDKATPPNGEPMPVFRQRVIEGWQRLVAAAEGEHVLLVAHGGTIRVLLSHVLDMPVQKMASIEVPYASVSRIRLYRQKDQLFPTVVFHNGTL